MTRQRDTISVVTPTLNRPGEVEDLLINLAEQTHLPLELMLVDGASEGVEETRHRVEARRSELPFQVRYFRDPGGTAVQRNVGIDSAAGRFIAFIDDDIRLEPDFFAQMMSAFGRDEQCEIGGFAGYISNQFLDPSTSRRWKWYRRLHLFSTYEPGRYDYRTGYPINRYLQPPHGGLREIDFMGAGCAVWRRQVFAGGLRFAPFFSGYGILEDAHFALRVGREWRLMENGRARCVHLKSGRSQLNSYEIAWKSAVNYRYVFLDIVPERSVNQEMRFWLVQLVDLGRFAAHSLAHPGTESFALVRGKLRGITTAVRLSPPRPLVTRQTS